MKRKNALYQIRQILLLNIYLMSGFTLVGCDIHIDDSIDRPTPLTEIVRVEVLPNPVAVGDSLTLRCVTKDSLATGTGYVYAWGLPEGYRYFSTHTIRVKAPAIPGTYDYTVTVRKDVPFTSFPSKVTQVTVIP